MSWLNDNRQSIKDTYFGDYGDIETWDEDTIKQYLRIRDWENLKNEKTEYVYPS